MNSLIEYINSLNISIESDYIDYNPNMEESNHMRHYICKLRRKEEDKQKQVSFFFSMGAACQNEPTVLDVLSCILLDCSFTDNGFDDFCDELGYSNDSIKALNVWKATQKNYKKVNNFLGEHYDKMTQCENDY